MPCIIYVFCLVLAQNLFDQNAILILCPLLSAKLHFYELIEKVKFINTCLTFVGRLATTSSRQGHY